MVIIHIFITISTEIDAELAKLMNEMMEKQKEIEVEQKKEKISERVEYDAVPDGLSTINFHLTIFLLLCILCLLNLPSVIMWARNYGYVQVRFGKSSSFQAFDLLYVFFFLALVKKSYKMIHRIFLPSLH